METETERTRGTPPASADSKSRRAGRKPLSDRTNALPSSLSGPKLDPPVKTNRRSIRRASRGSTTEENAPTPRPVAPHLASTPPLPLPFSSDQVIDEVFGPCTVHTRRKTTEKRKSKVKTVAAIPMTNSPPIKIRSFRNKLTCVRDDAAGSKSCTIPNKRKKETLPSRTDVSDHDLQDYIRQQNSYFAEIDSFELQEEEVPSSEDLD